MVPTLRKLEPPEKRIEILSSTARRFRTVSWIAILILLITGVLNAVNRGVTVEIISTGSLFLSHFGKILTVKVILVFIMLVLSTFHDFILGPKMVDAMSTNTSNPNSLQRLKKYQRYIPWLARVNAILGILVVACAVMLS
jgi:uncharacterized membrane protein